MRSIPRWSNRVEVITHSAYNLQKNNREKKSLQFNV